MRYENGGYSLLEGSSYASQPNSPYRHVRQHSNSKEVVSYHHHNKVPSNTIWTPSSGEKFHQRSPHFKSSSYLDNSREIQQPPVRDRDEYLPTNRLTKNLLRIKFAYLLFRSFNNNYPVQDAYVVSRVDDRRQAGHIGSSLGLPSGPLRMSHSLQQRPDAMPRLTSRQRSKLFRSASRIARKLEEELIDEEEEEEEEEDDEEDDDIDSEALEESESLEDVILH